MKLSYKFPCFPPMHISIYQKLTVVKNSPVNTMTFIYTNIILLLFGINCIQTQAINDDRYFTNREM